MTTVYFIRHAEPNYHDHDDLSRELSTKSLQDSQLIRQFFKDRHIDAIFSSPYKRAIDTIKSTAIDHQLDVQEIDDFRERKINRVWIENFTAFTSVQWHGFSYKLSDGESLQEVQDRNVTAPEKLLEDHRHQIILIGSHGTAISTIINYYQRQFSYAEFSKIKSLFPFILKMTFRDKECLAINLCNPFTGETHEIYPI